MACNVIKLWIYNQKVEILIQLILRISFYLLNYIHYFYQNDHNEIPHLAKTNAMLIFHKYFFPWILEIHTNCHLCENLLTQKKKWLELENRISKYTPCQEIIINWPIILLRLVLAHQSNDY